MAHAPAARLEARDTNSIHKVYLAGMKGLENLVRGDLLVIYRTTDNKAAARFRSVATSICVVEEVRDISSVATVDELIAYCTPYSVFTEDELREFWKNRRFPTIVRFTYNAAFKKRPNRGTLIDQNIISESEYAGFQPLTDAAFDAVTSLGEVNARLIVNSP